LPKALQAVTVLALLLIAVASAGVVTTRVKTIKAGTASRWMNVVMQIPLATHCNRSS
jgi:hypothetical protein